MRLPPGKLRNGAFIDLFIALIFDGDGEERAVRALGQRIGLAAQIAGGDDRLRGEINDGEVARGFRLGLGCDDTDKGMVAHDDSRSRFAAKVHSSCRLRHLRIGDVDQADPLAGTVGIDEGIAIGRRGNDLGDSRFGRIGAGGQVVDDVECGDAVEHFRRVARKRRAG